jgi:hypothetical protein
MLMGFRIVTELNQAGETRFYVQKRYHLLFIKLWFPLLEFSFPSIHPRYFTSKEAAKAYFLGTDYHDEGKTLEHQDHKITSSHS